LSLQFQGEGKAAAKLAKNSEPLLPREATIMCTENRAGIFKKSMGARN
jgi:hypothetical protein